MKFIVADDTLENLNAAKEAATSFLEHEFVFTNSAAEALKLLPDANGVVTDLFFPPEEHLQYSSPLFSPYNTYYESMSAACHTPVFDEVVATQYYGGKRVKAKNDHHDALELVATGTIRAAVEHFIRSIQMWGGDVSSLQKCLENLPAPQFPYGAAVMLVAKKAGKSHVLVTDMHRHAYDSSSASSAMTGLVLLLPLMEKGITTAEEVMWDGRNSSTYMASDRIWELAGNIKPAKTSPAVWAEAMRMVISGAS